MENKTLEFVKNGLLSVVPFVAGGWCSAELTDLLTDTEYVITTVSTVSQYICGFTAFMCLQARDNRDIYRKDKSWDYSKIFSDTGKTALAMGVADIAYVVARGGLMQHLQQKDYSAGEASLLADAIATPLYVGIAIPIAKKMGVIRSDNS